MDHRSCSFLAGLLGDRLIGTANETAAWVLLEHAGPWGKNALRDSDLAPELVAELDQRLAATGTRVQFISPPAGQRPSWTYVSGGPWLARLPSADPRRVLELDFAALAAGVPPRDALPVAEPLYIVCANDASDPCCGLAGPPVLAAATDLLGDRCRLTTHVGGHKYAANMMVFPPALCFGRLGPASVLDVIDARESGHIHLEQYRGRPAWRAADQAAEHFLRLELGLTALEDVVLVDPADGSADGRYRTRFSLVDGRRFDVLLYAEKRPPARLQSCSDAGPTVPVVWSCEGISAA